MKKTPCGCCQPCNCHEQPPQTAPDSVVNAAGADALKCRVGTHGTLFEAMRHRLSSRDYPQLAKLTDRKTSDPSIALLDAWATAGDVLTFYNERIANEAYLRTATERRSLSELSGLIGYRPGPGVASSVYLAFTLEKDPKKAAEETLIPKGTAVKSIPGGKELPQTFETAEDLVGRAEWSVLRPRLRIPQFIVDGKVDNLESIYLIGTDVAIKPNDEILLSVDVDAEPKVRIVTGVRVDYASKVTELSFEETQFSVRRLAREVVEPVDAFLDAKRPTSFDWMTKTVMGALDKIATGEGNIPPLNRMKRLSDLDARLTEWLEKGLAEKNLGVAINELGKSNSPFVVAPNELLAITTTEFTKLVAAAQLVCDELLPLDVAAQECFKAALEIDLTGPSVNIGEINIAKGKIDAALKNTPPPSPPPMPLIAVLASHLAKLTDLQSKVDAMAAGGASLPIADPKVTAFTGVKDELQQWWGLTPTGKLNGTNTKGATCLNKAFKDLSDGLALAGLSQGLLQMIVDQQKVIENTPPLGSSPNFSPAKERITALSDSLKAPLAAFDSLLKSTAPDATAGSEILTQLDIVVLRAIRDATDVVTRFTLAEALAKDKDEVAIRVDSARQLAGLMKSLGDSLEGRRKIFAVRAQSLLDLHRALETSPVQLVKDSWDEAKALLQGVTDKTQNDTQDPNSLFSHDLPLAQTIEKLRETKTGDGLINKLESLANAAEIGTKQVLMRLVRSLKAFAALNGGGTTSSSPTPATQGGAIGQAVGEGINASKEDRVLIRVADEVLSVPKNTAADVVAQLAASFGLISQQELKAKWQSVRNPPPSAFANTVSVPLSLFGHNAPRSIFDPDLKIIPKDTSSTAPFPDWNAEDQDYVGFIHIAAELTALEAPFWLRLRFEVDGSEKPHRIVETAIVNRSDYGITQKVTRCHMESPEENWQPGTSPPVETIELLRTTLAIVPQRRIDLAEAPIPSLIGRDAEASALDDEYDFKAEVDQIELEGIFLGLKPGQFVVIEGEREEFPGVTTRELKRIKFAQHKLRDLPGDTVHTRIYLNSALQHTYIRETVTVYANVVRATHGETVRQVLGSGDAGQAFQELSLAKGPITYIAAASPTGIESTLSVRVNNLQWHEKESLLDSGSGDRDYVVQADGAWRSSVQFGDGKTGARLPTGRENVRAEYRVGLGTAGNVKAGTITQLAGNKPLGLKDVTNPLAATGGADPENVDQIRSNAPLAVMALDRLVSVRDHADFARNYAAIEKAVAKRFHIGSQPTVHVTIAGAGDLPIADDSDLLANLKQAYRQLGDPIQVVKVDSRELLLIFLSVRIRLLPYYEWASVEPEIRKRLYEEFSFARRELAQDVYLSEVHSTIQSILGVAYVDVEVFESLSQRTFEEALKASAVQGAGNNSLDEVFKSLRTPSTIPNSRIAVASSHLEGGSIRPAQIAYLSPDVPDSLFLTEITS